MRYKNVKLASTLGIIGNIFLTIIKTTIGLITKSGSMIADATNSIGDVFSSLMTYIGNKIASIPPDEDHNLGHGKAEYIYSMLISIVMIIMSLMIIKRGTMAIINKTKYEFSIWLIIICVITILTKLGLFIYTNILYKKEKNLLIKANSKDHLNDTIMTSCNLISCILAQHNIFIFDGIVSIIIGLWILISAIKIYKEAYDILMDKAIDNSAKEKVYNIIKKHKEIKDTQHFNSTPIGYLYQISLTIFVSGQLTTLESHEIADKLEKEIMELDEIYLAVIHVNPIEVEDE